MSRREPTKIMTGQSEKLRTMATDRLSPVTPRTKPLPAVPVDAVAQNVHGQALCATLPPIRVRSGTGVHPGRERRLEGRTAVAAELLQTAFAAGWPRDQLLSALAARVWPSSPAGVTRGRWFRYLAGLATQSLHELGLAATAADAITDRCADCEALGEPNLCTRCSAARYAWHDVLAAYAQRITTDIPQAARTALAATDNYRTEQ